MHLDEQQRKRAMPRVAGLVRQSGVMMLSLRHGPVPPGRRTFEVSADETRGSRGSGRSQALVLVLETQDGLLLGAPA